MKPRPASPDAIFERVTRIFDEARASVVRSVNSAMVLAYWQIGREIVETLQGGDRRGSYGERTVEELALRLTQRFGRGFSATKLKCFRKFYAVYADRTPVLRATWNDAATDSEIRHNLVTNPRERRARAVTARASLPRPRVMSRSKASRPP